MDMYFNNTKKAYNELHEAMDGSHDFLADDLLSKINSLLDETSDLLIEYEDKQHLIEDLEDKIIQLED